MNSFKCILIVGLSVIVFFSCADNWDNHYAKHEAEINNENVDIVDKTTIEYLKDNAHYSSMTELFETTGVFHEMDSLNLLYTLFVVKNDVFEQPENKEYISKGHVTSASFSPSTLNDGKRVVMWNKKYVNITRTTDEGSPDEQISLNGSNVMRVIKTTNGYIYELDALITTPMSLLELIESLDDSRYSIFKDLVLSRNIRIFDRSASLPIGVDNSGNTVYDSVFTIRNPYFESKGFDLANESMRATMLIPSNELIENAVNEGKDKLNRWRVEREDSILYNWCFQVAFFNQEYTPEDFENNLDLPVNYALGQNRSHNVFQRQWRTTVNKVDLDNPIEMSNGTAYYMTELHIPQNILIYRLKDRPDYYEKLTAADKEKYFAFDNVNLSSYRLRTYTTFSKTQPWSPHPDWPTIWHRSAQFRMQNTEKNYVDAQGRVVDKAEMEITCAYFKENPDNTYEIEPVLIPPGEYTFHFGVPPGLKFYVDFYINGKYQGGRQTPTEWTNLGQGSQHRLDTDAGEYPEGYSSSIHNRYDRDGRQLGDIVVIEGDEPVEIRLRMVITELGTGWLSLYHWCFKPTVNCY